MSSGPSTSRPLAPGVLRYNRAAGRFIATILVALTTGPALGAQRGNDPRSDFLDALGRFSLALDGTYGDEARLLSESLEAMAGALSRWDAAVESYERSMAAEIGAANPQLAARMHLALGGVYLDRGRITDALGQLAAARKADPTRADVPTLEALVHAQLTSDAAAATGALKTAASLDSGDPVRTYLLARHLLKLGEEGGLALLQRVQSDRQGLAQQGSRSPFIRLGMVQEVAGIEPFLPPVLYADGFTSLQNGDLARAIAQLREALPRDPVIAAAPTSNQDPVALAGAAFRDGLVDEARTRLEAAIAQTPGRAEAYRVLGMVNVADAAYDRGITALRTAVRLNPSDERSRVALCDALVKSDQLDAAEQALGETLDIFPTSGRARYLLGLMYQRQGKAADALRELQAARAQKPLLGANTIDRMIGVLHQDNQDLDKAVEAFSARVDAIPNAPEAHRDLGKVYLDQGEHVRARAEFEVALLLDPSNVEAYTALGQVHLREGRNAEAADAARRALELNPAEREARYVRATALIRLGSTEEGTREMQVFQRLQAEDAEARTRAFELGRLRREAAISADAGDQGRAVALLQQALVVEPTAAASHLDLGLALLKAGQAAEAVDRLTTAAALNAPFDVHRHLADAYAALGRTEESEKARTTYMRMKQEAIRRTGRSR